PGRAPRPRTPPPSPGTRRWRSRSSGLADQDLVDTHATLLEREAAADEVEPPHARHLFAYQRDHCVPAHLEVIEPLLPGAHVVLAQTLHTAHLEPARLEQPDGLTERAHVHVGRDVGLDERTAA